MKKVFQILFWKNSINTAKTTNLGIPFIQSLDLALLHFLTWNIKQVLTGICCIKHHYLYQPI